MTVDPGKISEIAQATVGLYRNAEQAILGKVTRYLAHGLDAPDWAVTRLGALATLRSTTQRVLQLVESDTATSIRETLAAAYRTGRAEATTGIPAQLLPRDPDAVRAAAALAQVPRAGVVENLAAALVQDIGERHSNVLRHVLDAYRLTVTQATASSVAGGLTRRQAAQQTYARFVDQGITAFTDRRGRTWRLSSYVEMALRTVTQRAAVQGQTDRQTEMGLSFVMVSNEAQECVRCRPFEGRILRIDGGPIGTIAVPHQITGESVKITVTATLDTARAAGLQHPGCRHSIRAYLPGVTKLPQQPTGDPRGDTARQRQREIERQIRRWKERQAAALTPDGKAAAAGKIKAWQAEMRTHLAANPTLKRQPHREQIGAGNLPPGTRSTPAPPPSAPSPPPAPAAPPPAPALPQRRPVRQQPDRVEDLPGLLQLDYDHQLVRDMARDVFADIIGGDYAGLRVEVQRVTMMGGVNRRGLHVTGKIWASDDPNAAEAGIFARGFYRDRDGDLVAIHALLHLENAYRGKGFAGAFNGHLEKWYRQQGIVRIEVHANIDVGGYTWATQGFQFEDEVSALDILDRLRFVISVFTDRVQAMRDEARDADADADRARTLREQASKLEAQMAEAEDILDRADQARFGDDDYPTSWEISQCGRSHDIGRKDRPWIGKAAMLGSDWHGVKWL